MIATSLFVLSMNSSNPEDFGCLFMTSLSNFLFVFQANKVDLLTNRSRSSDFIFLFNFHFIFFFSCLTLRSVINCTLLTKQSMLCSSFLFISFK